MHFRTLAQYIGVFGTPNNTRKEGMAMTAPVCPNLDPLHGCYVAT